ncbi:MAG: WHG domain-containing protein [Clostridia bacterium]|nr:WHG domain-containing protein [Clostridia bacterium]
MILERSFAMFCREGMEAVNARSVAKALNCSTQPIFSYYAGMNDLKTTLDQHAHELWAQTLEGASREGNWFENCCCAYLRFACEQPQLFAHLFMRVGKDTSAMGGPAEWREDMIRYECEAYDLNEANAQELCVRLLTYVHGLATVKATRMEPYTDDLTAQVHAVHSALKASL